MQVEGSCYKNCDNLVDSFNSLANLKSVEIRFEDNKLDNSRLVENLIAKCSSVGLRNIRILYRDRRMAALSTIQERFGSTLEKLHLEFPDDQSYARVQDNQWEANLTACSRLTHFHIPSYQQAVNAMAAMTNLKVVGVTFNVGNVEFWNSWRSFIFRPVASNTVETLVLEGNLVIVPKQTGPFNVHSSFAGFPIMANESFWIAWPSESIRKIELSLASDSRDEIVYCLDRISGTFLNLEELVWKEPSTRPLLKTKAPAFWGTRINHAKTDLFFFPNVSKLSLPINREDAIYRYCPYVSQLKFTWNSNVKEEHLLDGMMPDVLKHYGDQIKTIEVEQNPDEKFVIPDMILWRIQDKCRNAKIVIVNL